MIGTKLQEFRKYIGIHSSQLAKDIKVSSALISLIEGEKRTPNFNQLSKILYQLAKYSTITDLNYDHFVNEETYQLWLEKLTIDDDPEYDSIEVEMSSSNSIFFSRQEVSSKEELDKRLHHYFFNFSYREREDYLDYQKGRNQPAIHHRFTRVVPLINELNLDNKVTDWWLNYFLQELIKVCYENLDKLSSKEETLYQRLTRTSPAKLVESLHEQNDFISISQMLHGFDTGRKEIILDVDDLFHRRLILQLDEERLEPSELRLLKVVLEGIRVDRQKRQDRRNTRR